MKLLRVQETYGYHSQTASQITRSLGLGGVAATWLIGGGIDQTTADLKLTSGPLLVMAAFVVALTLDLAHYAVSTASWGLLGWTSERRFRRQGVSGTKLLEMEVGVPSWINWAPLALFWLKLALLGMGYIGLAVELFTRL